MAKGNLMIYAYKYPTNDSVSIVQSYTPITGGRMRISILDVNGESASFLQQVWFNKSKIICELPKMKRYTIKELKKIKPELFI
jgi:hypothetical protein